MLSELVSAESCVPELHDDLWLVEELERGIIEISKVVADLIQDHVVMCHTEIGHVLVCYRIGHTSWLIVEIFLGVL